MKAPIRVSLKTVVIGSQTLSLYLDAAKKPTIGYKERSFNSLDALVEAFPQLIENLATSAELANFLMRGLAFHLIQDIETFKRSYRAQLDADLNENEEDNPLLVDYGNFDLSGLHPPRINDGRLVFFVQEGHTRLPYQVSVPFPYTSPQPSIYALLPYGKGSET